MLTVPLLAVGSVLTQIDVQIIWRYFSWSNQTLAMIALWSASVYLFQMCIRDRSISSSRLADTTSSAAGR